MDESHKDRDPSLVNFLTTHRVTMPLQHSPAMLAAIVDDTPLPMMLFYRHQRVKHIVTLLHGPTQVVKDYTPRRRISYDPTNKRLSMISLTIGALVSAFYSGRDQEDCICAPNPFGFPHRIRYTPKSRYRCCRIPVVHGRAPTL